MLTRSPRTDGCFKRQSMEPLANRTGHGQPKDGSALGTCLVNPRCLRTAEWGLRTVGTSSGRAFPTPVSLCTEASSCPTRRFCRPRPYFPQAQRRLLVSHTPYPRFPKGRDAIRQAEFGCLRWPSPPQLLRVRPVGQEGRGVTVPHSDAPKLGFPVSGGQGTDHQRCLKTSDLRLSPS